jgi:hypothetical protein
MSKIEAVVLKAVCSIEPAVAAGCRSLFKHGGSCCSEVRGAADTHSRVLSRGFVYNVANPCDCHRTRCRCWGLTF